MTNKELEQFLTLLQKLQWLEFKGKYQGNSFECFECVRNAALWEIGSNCQELAKEESKHD